jgi:hypothetical protein
VDERRFNAFTKILAVSTWPARGLVEVAAYGEVVWSWHPLLMLSRRRCVGPTGLRQTIFADDGDKKEFVAGEHEGNR